MPTTTMTADVSLCRKGRYYFIDEDGTAGLAVFWIEDKRQEKINKKAFDTEKKERTKYTTDYYCNSSSSREE